MGRTILSVLAGVVVCGIGVFVVQTASHQMFPPPEGMDPSNAESIKAYMAQIPLAALLMVVLSYVVGAFAGGAVAAKLAAEKPMRSALFVGGIFTLVNFSNLYAIPHPLWMAVLTTVVFIPCAWLGAKLVLSMKPAAG